MTDQNAQPVAPSDADTVVLRLPRQRNGRGYPGARSFTVTSSIATNSVPASRFPARSLREVFGL